MFLSCGVRKPSDFLSERRNIGSGLGGYIIMAQGKERDIILETTRGRQKILYRSCRALLEELDSPQFIFCSRSIIVNKNYIERVDAANGYVYLRGIEYAVPMGKQKKYDFLREIKRGLL